ncbi:hypothetical protein [Pseudoduganella namucuonensis]|uniref:hypothetical protein n=1 Tax=Pseudoduganella namucuonensis TaxID=1035707 RepID=UPI001160BFCB|nr:hypothetical protein [Pseudoduganella namucuonensis]
MKTPIYVSEHGDVSAFDTVEAAERYVEAVDIGRQEYIVTDGDGHRLAVGIVVRHVPLLGGLFRGKIRLVRITEGVGDRHLAAD